MRQESYSYDLNGNLASSTDRKSQVTSLTYDPLNRSKLVGYNTVVNAGVTSYESTVGYTYDAGNRMTQAVDSAGGTITEARTYKTLPSELNPFNPNGTFYKEANAIGDSAVGTVTGDWAKVAGGADNTPLEMTAMYGRSCDPFAKYVGYYGVRGALAGAALADMVAGALMVRDLFDDMPTNVDPNRVIHIFDNPAHNLGPVVNALGGEANTFNAIEGAVQAQGLSNGLFTTVVNVGGSNVTVTGIVINGIARIGSAFIP